MPSFTCACGNQDLEYKKGISKKTNKAWQGWRCAPCNAMYGMDGKPWGAGGYQRPQTHSTPTPGGSNTITVSSPKEISGVTLETLDKKLDLIIRALELSGQGFPE